MGPPQAWGVPDPGADPRPSRDRDALLDAIHRLDPGKGTAIGEAVVTSLAAVEDAPAGDDGEPAPARIVLMSDGETTSGISNEEGRAGRGGRGPGGHDRLRDAGGTIDDPVEGAVPVPVAPEPLADLSAATGGAYEAGSLGELGDAYADISRVAGSEEVERDVSAWFVGAGIALLAAAGSLSLLWSQRLP